MKVYKGGYKRLTVSSGWRDVLQVVERQQPATLGGTASFFDMAGRVAPFRIWMSVQGAIRLVYVRGEAAGSTVEWEEVVEVVQETTGPGPAEALRGPPDVAGSLQWALVGVSAALTRRVDLDLPILQLCVMRHLSVVLRIFTPTRSSHFSEVYKWFGVHPYQFDGIA